MGDKHHEQLLGEIILKLLVLWILSARQTTGETKKKKKAQPENKGLNPPVIVP